MTGTTIAQAIPIAISPILTRIYTPEDFGVFSLFLSISAIFGSIANGRYELAIMLPKKDEDAINILALGVMISFVISFILFSIVLVFNTEITSFLNNDTLSIWLYFIPLTVLLTGLFNVLNYYNNRKKNYKDLAKANVLKSIALAITQLSIGFLKEGASGLISGQILSQIVANTKLITNILKEKVLLSKISKLKIIALAKRYKDFPKYSMWSGLANTSAYNVTNILISSLFSVATLGFYSLVQKILGMPSSLIGGSISQVFFQEATKEKQATGSARVSFVNTVKKLIMIGLPSFTVLFFTVEELFAFIFSEEWRIAGSYAQILIPLFFIRFVVAPVTIMNVVFEKNHIGMYWQFSLLITNIFTIYYAKLAEYSFVEYLYLSSFLNSLEYFLIFFIIKNYNKVENV